MPSMLQDLQPKQLLESSGLYHNPLSNHINYEIYREEYLFSLLDLVEWSDIVDIMHCERNILYISFFFW